MTAPILRAPRCAVVALALAVALLEACSGDRPLPAPPSDLPSYSAADYAAWERDRPWRSREEFFQLCAHLDETTATDGLFVSPEALRAMADDMSCLFPLSHCTGIEFRHGVVTIAFDSARSIAIPASYGQISLETSPSLALAMRRRTIGARRVIELDVTAGQLSLSVSHLASEVSFPYVRDMRITRLIYVIDDEARSSSIIAEEIQRYPRVDIHHGSSLDIVDDRHRGTDEIMVQGDRLYVDMRSDFPERYYNLAKAHDLFPDAAASQRTIATAARQPGATSIPGGLLWRHLVIYDLETRRAAGGSDQIEPGTP